MSLLPGVGLLIMNNIVMSEPFNERVVVGRIRKQGVIDASPLRFTPEPLPKRPRRRTNWYDAEAYLLDTRDHYKQLERERLQRAEERYYGDDL